MVASETLARCLSVSGLQNTPVNATEKTEDQDSLRMRPFA